MLKVRKFLLDIFRFNFSFNLLIKQLFLRFGMFYGNYSGLIEFTNLEELTKY